MIYVDERIKNTIRLAQPEGRGPYIRLDQNENPDGIPRWLFDRAMARITPEYLSMYPEESKLAAEYAKVIGLKEENIALTDGSVVAMGYVIKVFGEPGKDLVCVTPTFGMYKVYADLQGLNTKFVHYEKDYTFDIGKLLAEIDGNTSIVSLVNPNMPIGNAYAREEILAVVEKAKACNALVVIDEAYYLFHKETALDLVPEHDNVIILRTFSKLFSIPGLRLGIIISNAENVQYVRNYKPHYTVNAMALAVAEEIVANYGRVVAELSEKFEGGKKWLRHALAETGYSFLPTEGCFICITPKHKTAEYITDRLKQHGILIFCGKGDSAGFLRVTIWDRKYMEMFMKELVQIDVP